jgi:ABC-type multidrug transport system fused ATPase/permease subunit
VRRAATLANAEELILNLDQGFNTMLGPNGTNLSGGQRQRIDLARALVLQTPILILDEPTGGLDVEAELAFRHALERIRSETDTTIIIISHRLSDVMDADLIIVFENGRVSAAGTHAENLRSENWYSRMISENN